MSNQHQKSGPKFNFTAAMQELEALNMWFQRSDIDLEEALVKLRRGQELVSQCRTRLRELENEFTEIQNDSASMANKIADGDSAQNNGIQANDRNDGRRPDELEDELNMDLPF